MTFRSIRILAVAGALSVVLGIIGWWIYASVGKLPESEVPAEIQQAIQTMQPVDFGQHVQGDWDTLWIRPPYDQPEQHVPDFPRIHRLQTQPPYQEGVDLLLFCQGNKIERYFYLNNLENIPDSYQIPREKAVFSPEENPLGEALLKFSPPA